MNSAIIEGDAKVLIQLKRRHAAIEVGQLIWLD